MDPRIYSVSWGRQSSYYTLFMHMSYIASSRFHIAQHSTALPIDLTSPSPLASTSNLAFSFSTADSPVRSSIVILVCEYVYLCVCVCVCVCVCSVSTECREGQSNHSSAPYLCFSSARVLSSSFRTSRCTDISPVRSSMLKRKK